MFEKSRLSRLELVRIGRSVRRSELDAVSDRIRDAFAGLLDSVRLHDFEAPEVEEIEAELLTRALDEEFGGHVLGITGADLFDGTATDFFRFMFGCKDNRSDVAVVSTRRIASRDETRSLARLLKVALHELGHNFGLVHHYDFVRAPGGAYCPMSKGDYNRHGERSYVRSVIDARGFRFCDACRKFLRLAHTVQA